MIIRKKDKEYGTFEDYQVSEDGSSIVQLRGLLKTFLTSWRNKNNVITKSQRFFIYEHLKETSWEVINST